MAEDLADYLKELGVKVQYLHSEVDTLERVAILRDLRLGVYDVLVGINLLREGLDLPEVTLVAILDADKEGFLRSAWSLIQMIGRAARNTGGEVVMYADRITESMKVAIDETDRRRTIQERYNEEHGIEPQTIIKGIRDINDRLRAVAENTVMYSSERQARNLEAADKAEVERLVAKMEAEMKAAAKQLEFERAAALRDEIQQIRLRVLERGRERPRRPCGGARGPGRGAAGQGARGRPPARRRRARRGRSRRSRSPRSWCCRRARSRPVARTPTRARWASRRSCSRASATSTTTTTAAGRPAGSTGRPGTATVTPNIRRRTGQRPTRRTRGY